MTSPRSATHEFVRLLQAVGQPLCLVDDERRIVFLNDECAKWLGFSTDDLLGRKCRYQSGDADPMAAAADALCPPPHTFQGQRAVGVVVKPTADASLERRRVEFIPLAGSDDDAACVLVVLDRENLPDDATEPALAPASAEVDESQQLHEIVARFRRDLNQWHHPNRLAGRSPAMIRVRAQVILASAGQGTVLIVGPPGIGRQHIARTIHSASQSKGAFTPISCSALPPDLLRSSIESIGGRRMQAEEKSPATVVLLDVDQLPAELQHDLAQRMANGWRNIRIMATAAERLDLLAGRSEFRGDLAQLLGTLVIELPPLASRPDDIPILAQMFVEDLNAQGSRQIRGFTSETMDRLVEYAWPGQIDELDAVVREAAMQAEESEIRAADLPKRLRHAAEAVRYARRPAEPIDLEQFLARVEKELIERALREVKGNKSQTARLLGLTRPRLYRRMVQLGLERGEPTIEDNA
jgi:DNA-binding NtrC family response regulator